MSEPPEQSGPPEGPPERHGRGTGHRWSSEAVAAEDQRRMQELMFQRRFPVPRRRPAKDADAETKPSRRRSALQNMGGLGVVALVIATLALGMTLRGALDGEGGDGSGNASDGVAADSAAQLVPPPTITVPVIVQPSPPGTPRLCKLPDDQTGRPAGALFTSADGNREVQFYSPFRVIQYPCSNVPGNVRALLIYRDAIVLLEGGEVARAIPFDATATVSFRQVFDAVSDADWIAEPSEGVFQVDTAFIQMEGTTLTVTAPEVKEIRLTTRPYLFFGGRGATATFDSVKFTSWDTQSGGPDVNAVDGRAFILYERGSRLDINKSQISYMGSDRSGGAYGTSWRAGGTTGSAIDTIFDHNWFGVYTLEARDITFRGNQFVENDVYGLDPHDYSHGLIVEQNIAYGNGSHGLIFSTGVVDSVLRDNHVYDNGGNGIVLDLGSNNNVIENNLVENNKKDGIVLIGSGESQITNNTVRGNRTGIRVNNPGSRDVDISSNLVEDNRTGIQIFNGAGDVRLNDNVITNTAGTALVAAGQTTVNGLEIVDARVGIDTRSAIDIENVKISAVDVGLLARDRGIIEARATEVDAREIGLRLLPGTTASTSDDVLLRAPELIKATSNELNWRHVLPYIGVGAILAAIFLEIVRGSRTRGEWARLAPAGVTNIR